MKLYKLLVNGNSCNGGNLRWSLPTNSRPGRWHKVEGELVPCKNGIHVTHKPYDWYSYGTDIYEVGCRGNMIDEFDKTVVSECRLIKNVTPRVIKRIHNFVEKTLPTILEREGDNKPLPTWEVIGKTKRRPRSLKECVWTPLQYDMYGYEHPKWGSFDEVFSEVAERVADVLIEYCGITRQSAIMYGFFSFYPIARILIKYACFDSYGNKKDMKFLDNIMEIYRKGYAFKGTDKMGRLYVEEKRLCPNPKDWELNDITTIATHLTKAPF